MNIDFIILAAGKGTRMGGDSPKVLASLAGKPMIQHLIDTVDSFPKSKTSIIVGYKSKEVESGVASSKKISFINQKKQLGTAHAVKQAFPALRKNSISVVLYGDAPLITKSTLNKLIKPALKGNLSVLTFMKEDPTGYGRIIRGSRNSIQKITEHKDASSVEREIKEVNSGVLAIKTDLLLKYIPKIKNNNAAKEYYLTDLVEISNQCAVDVTATVCDSYEVGGANDKSELHDLERAYQKKLGQDLLKKGIAVADTSRIDIRGEIKIGQNSFIDINNVFEGCNVLGFTSSLEKANWVKDNIGIEVIVSKGLSHAQLSEETFKVFPDGMDAYQEHVDNTHLFNAMTSLKPKSTLALCGLMRTYNGPMAPGPNLNMSIWKNINIQGFMLANFPKEVTVDNFFTYMSEKLPQFKWKQSTINGIENMDSAFLDMFQNFDKGKIIINLQK